MKISNYMAILKLVEFFRVDIAKKIKSTDGCTWTCLAMKASVEAPKTLKYFKTCSKLQMKCCSKR